MLEILNDENFVVFTTRDYAGTAQLSMPGASKSLARLEAKGVLVRITKGVWANTRHPWFSPLACLPYLLNNEQGYLSFLSALNMHGILSQIPRRFQIASSGHARTLQTPVGEFEFLQLKPELMQQGVQWSETHLPYLLASPEKALLDCLYISTRRNKRFARLPELDLEPPQFNKRQFAHLLREFQAPKRILNAMAEKAASLGL